MSPESEIDPKPEGLGASVQRTGELFLRTLRNRAELFGLELEDEGRWVVAALIWAAAAIFFAVLAITVVTVAVVWLVPPDARPWVLVGFSVFYLALATGTILGAKKHLQSRRPPLSDTINELKKDLDCLRPRD